MRFPAAVFLAAAFLAGTAQAQTPQSIVELLKADYDIINVSPIAESYAVFLENADADTIRVGLETLLRDPAAAAARAENAYENLCAHFTWQAVFATMMEVISAKRS